MRHLCLFGFTVLAACSQPPPDDVDSDAADTDVLVPHHEVVVHNQSGAVNNDCATQLTRVELTPNDGGDLIGFDVVINPGGEAHLSVPMPVTRTFRVEVFPIAGGPSIWWDGQAMAPRGTTTVFIQGINTGFTENSWCNSIRASGSTLVCGG